ncbi:hypothetical protein AVL62_13475 [Serinicoccus chungangensis]|uniref:Uncharacterized protein n=1 Tax=Serinicoccus chungangensis TaxID=767452 RepID=A0A0W8IBV7_9MICO|nr:hypothetical protein [Serinicoccus chungangensis]KUG57429.1 hypothetical protein AVL62_13475 [Serinicoccus chungangensis]
MTTSTATTLALWEALAGASPVLAGAALLHARGDAPSLAAACDLPLAAAAAAAVGQLRQRCGDHLDTVAACPSCSARLEVALPLRDLDEHTRAWPATRTVGTRTVRSPTTRDLAAALTTDDPASTLRASCAALDDAATEQERQAVLTAAEDLCGAADLSVRVTCPECGHTPRVDVDPVALLTDQLATESAAVLQDVAELAAAYGWREAEILDLSPARRAAYLSLARGRR